MEIVENALSSTADSEANLEAELAVDTDAVTSAVPWEQRKIGELMSNADGGPSPLFRGVQLVAALVAILVPIVRVDGYAAEAGMEQPNELLWLSMLGLFPCAFAMVLLVLGSALLLGGYKHPPVQRYTKMGAHTSVAVLVLAISGLAFPAILDATHSFEADPQKPDPLLARHKSSGRVG